MYSVFTLFSQCTCITLMSIPYHGLFETIAWLVLFPLGAFVARYRLFGKQWFRIHLIIQTVAFALNLVGFMFAFSMRSTRGNHLTGVHSIAGLVLFAASCIQVISASQRPRFGYITTQPSRRLWLLQHRVFTLMMLCTGYFVMYTGLQEPQLMLKLAWNTPVMLLIAFCTVLSALVCEYYSAKLISTNGFSDSAKDVNLTTV